MTLGEQASADAMISQAAPQATCRRACSACAGDYEDPERTAPREIGDEEDAVHASAEDAKRFTPRDEFPALEE
jgi:hypothetical protein